MIKLTKDQIDELVRMRVIGWFDSLNYDKDDCSISFSFWENDLEGGIFLLEQRVERDAVDYLESCGISDETIYQMYLNNDYTESEEMSNDKLSPTCVFEIEFEYLGDIKVEGVEISGFYAPNQLILF